MGVRRGGRWGMGGLAAVLCLGLGAAGVYAQEADPLSDEAIDQRIREHRTAEVGLRVVGAGGRPLAGAEVTVRQVEHRFGFGSNIYMFGRFDEPALERGYRERFDALLNSATLPFYWGAYERSPGETDRQRIEAIARWCVEQGIAVKGHPLVWHEVVPGWLEDVPPGRVEALLLGRVEREVTAFRGLIDAWDVLNEPVVLPEFRGGDNPISRLAQRRGAVDLIAAAFDRARQANPDATLLINDYITSADYERVIRESVEASVQIDAIGIQSHMHHGHWDPERIWDVCERFAAFGKPLHFTEVTILSGMLKTWDDFRRRDDWHTTEDGEARQAEHVRRFYRILFSHPAVEAITWWDFSDRGAWQGAPAGLVRADMTPKPAYEELIGLIRGEWWTDEQTLRTDAEGRAEFRGFLGEYELDVDGERATFTLDEPGRREVTVTLP